MSRSGNLVLAKECSAYTGAAGDHCTLTASNIEEIGAGARIVYAKAVEGGSLDSDIVLDAGDGNTANGHVVLDLSTGTGTVTLAGGTGTLADFHAEAAVSADAAGMWHWAGTFSFADTQNPVVAGA